MEEKIIKKYMPLILKYSRLAPENDREDLEQELIMEIIELYRKGNGKRYNNIQRKLQYTEIRIQLMKSSIKFDFNRLDYGDPWEEFNRIVWCAGISKQFASGRIIRIF